MANPQSGHLISDELPILPTKGGYPPTNRFVPEY
jgi:hypothetical protein